MDRYLLATSGAEVRKIDGMSEADAPAFDTDMAQDAGDAARWMLHCHHMPHLSADMMTEFAVSA
jgi:FtsP/CotA-like multicopper oxidase with cupredoxin domain